MSLTEKSPGPEYGLHTQWTQRRQDVAAVMWPAFVVACIATMIFFAFFDPVLLGDIASPPLSISRMTGYALGFFLFWLFFTLSSALTLYLVRTSHPPDGSGND